jgi:hypothetical protein
MNRETEARMIERIAEKFGYAVVLFHADTVKDKYDVTDKHALFILYDALMNQDWNVIHKEIDNICQCDELQTKQQAQ